MKYISMAFLFISLSQTVMAKKYSASIHSIALGSGSDHHFVRFNNGRISFIDRYDKALLRALQRSAERNEVVGVEVDARNNLFAAQSQDPVNPSLDVEDLKEWNKPTASYVPSVLKNNDFAKKVFNSMRGDYRSSGQCYNRAHVWTYENYKKFNLNSMKIFMFFTDRYIRKYKFAWWFHVTPMLYTGDLESPRTFDRRYTSEPRQTKAWSDFFIKSKRRCKRVTRFDEFWLNQKSQDCYHIHTSMYYVIPRDIEKRDLTGLEKTHFNQKEILRAYKDGFK